jgi:hypothetical protein
VGLRPKLLREGLRMQDSDRKLALLQQMFI